MLNYALIDNSKDWAEIDGELLKLNSNSSVIYLKQQGADVKMIELRFAYDCAVDLLIDDLDLVSVKGYYDKISKVLFVEEIEPIQSFVSTASRIELYCG